MKPPPVRDYDSFEREPISEYLRRWPGELRNFPECVIENWVHRHWNDFEQFWVPLDLEAWTFSQRSLNNDEIMKLGHFDDWFETLDHWGDELFTNKIRQSTWLGRYMLTNGAIPAPLIVAVNAVGVLHPRGRKGETMKLPTHLLEGHMRLAYLRGLIRHGHPALQEKHSIWELRMPNQPLQPTGLASGSAGG